MTAANFARVDEHVRRDESLVNDRRVGMKDQRHIVHLWYYGRWMFRAAESDKSMDKNIVYGFIQDSFIYSRKQTFRTYVPIICWLDDMKLSYIFT